MGYHKPGRRVCVVGIGCTPIAAFGDPQYDGYSMQDFFAWASMEAMEDAGLTAQDIDKLSFGMITNWWGNGHTITQNAPFADLIGMTGKSSCHHEEACATGYLCIDDAVTSVASGQYDIVMAGAVDFTMGIVDKIHPSHILHPNTDSPEIYGGAWDVGEDNLFDSAYTKFIGGKMVTDEAGRRYIREYGLSFEALQKTYNAAIINNRYNASRNPRAMFQTEFKDVAKQFGISSAEEYLTSKYNPMLTQYTSAAGLGCFGNAAACVIVTTPEIARSLKQQPIEVLAIGTCTYSIRHPRTIYKMHKGAAQRAYEMSGVKPGEIQLFDASDGFIGLQLDAAEAAGFLPEGQGWKYIQEGRTTFEGDKPINTNGGTTSFGHTFAASGTTHFCEQIWQMRGQAGARQVKKIPETAMLVTMGGGQNSIGTILRTLK